VKYSVSASTLEEKEAEIRDLKQFIDAQKKMLNEVIQNNQILTTKNEQLKNEIDSKPDPEPSQTFESEKDEEQDEKYETIKKDYYKLEEHFKETNKAKDKLYKELVQTREKLDQHEKLVIENTAKISELEAQNASLEKTVRQGKLQIDQMMTGMPLQPMNNLGGYIDYSSRTNFQENLEKSRGENTKAAPPSFFAKKVIKPIRGGGKKRQSNVFEMNPYGSNQQLNKEYNNYAMKSVRKGSGNEMKFYKPPPSINPFTPVIKPGDSPNEFSRKSIKQLQRENKKKNYMDDFLQAQRMIADESINNPDESINIDDKGSEYSSPERQEEMLSHLQSYPKQNLRPSHRHSLKSTPSMGSMGQSAAKPAEKTKDSENPFQPKKKKGLGSTLSKVWKGIF